MSQPDQKVPIKSILTIRRENLIKLLKRFRVEAFLITNIKNIRYLTGFSGSTAMLLLSEQNCVFITDFRYEQQSKQEVADIEIFIADNYFKAIKHFVKKWKVQNVGFEASQPYQLYDSLQKFCHPKPLDALVERLRLCKDREELKNIKLAVERAEKAFQKVKPYIKAGKTEREIALRLEDAIKRQGAMALPFEIIVASGENSAMPHARVTQRKLQPGDLIIIDWGAEANGYFSDMTRTFLIKGSNINKKLEIYNIVKEANSRAIKAVKPEVSVSDIDRQAREYINSLGYMKFFRHSTGHGVGLDVHEEPRIASTSRTKVKKGFVFTIEPGIYIPGVGGVRIEDMVYVSDTLEILTSLPKELEIIG